MSTESEDFVILNGEQSSESSNSAVGSRQDSVESEHDAPEESSKDDEVLVEEKEKEVTAEDVNNALPQAILLEGPVPAEAPMDWTIRPEQEQFYSDEARAIAVNNLIVFSLAMFSVPFIVMYICFYYVFENYETKDDMLYSGIAAMVSVYVIVALFIYVAYREEQEASTGGETKDSVGPHVSDLSQSNVDKKND